MNDLGILLVLIGSGSFTLGAWFGYKFRNKEIDHLQREIRNQITQVKAIKNNLEDPNRIFQSK